MGLEVKKTCTKVDVFDLKLEPNHPGSHMNVDVMKQAKQLILVNMDMFSSYVLATIIKSETRDDLVQGIIPVITPIRHCDTVQVRVD